MSKGRVFLFLWNEEEAKAAAQTMRDWGWDVDVEWQDGARGSAAVKSAAPAAVVFYLNHKPSHSQATAEYLAQTKATRTIPLVFVGGEGEGLEKTKAKIPGGQYIQETQLQAALEEVSA